MMLAGMLSSSLIDGPSTALRPGRENLALERRGMSGLDLTSSLVKVSAREGNLETRIRRREGRKAHGSVGGKEKEGEGGRDGEKRLVMASMMLAVLGMEGGMYEAKSGGGKAGAARLGCGFVLTVPNSPTGPPPPPPPPPLSVEAGGGGTVTVAGVL